VVDSKNVRPVSKALNGETGQGEYTDYRHKEIVAAWHFLEPLQLGITVYFGFIRTHREGIT